MIGSNIGDGANDTLNVRLGSDTSVNGREPVDPPRPDNKEELLIDGQEEVFSRAEIENGVVEHKAET